MAITVGQDEYGIWAVVECDRFGCERHVALRPAGGQSAYETTCAAFDLAEDEGWALRGQTFCPEHPPRQRTARVRPQVGDGYEWASVSDGRRSGAPRPS